MSQELNALINDTLEGLKGKEILSMDVTELSDVMDTLIIATGTSSRHVKSLASSVAEDAKKAGFMPLGVEGLNSGDWVLCDFGDIVVHVMLAQAREFYDLEKLWSTAPENRSKS
tara:strand:+ start:3502 stop:3843 length:342 start_codon:yes stop_codon:yes gene_type:complete